MVPSLAARWDQGTGTVIGIGFCWDAVWCIAQDAAEGFDGDAGADVPGDTAWDDAADAAWDDAGDTAWDDAADAAWDDAGGDAGDTGPEAVADSISLTSSAARR